MALISGDVPAPWCWDHWTGGCWVRKHAQTHRGLVQLNHLWVSIIMWVPRTLFALKVCFVLSYRSWRAAIEVIRIFLCKFFKMIIVELVMVPLTVTLWLEGNVDQLWMSPPPERLRQVLQKWHWLPGRGKVRGVFRMSVWKGQGHRSRNFCETSNPLLAYSCAFCSSVTSVTVLKCKSQM